MSDREAVISRTEFVTTPVLSNLIARASTYLEAGLSIHLRGPSGTGKTTLALHLASLRGRPTYLIYGNEAYHGYELVGKVGGFRQRVLIDNFIHSVEKRFEEVDPLWVDGRLTQAVRGGGTLIYDEFTRSRPEANNVLLSLLEEGLLEVPDPHHGVELIRVHPDFRMILTSNPDEYAGVNWSPDALWDRVATLDMTGYDDETEAAIISVRADIPVADARVIIHSLRSRRQSQNRTRSSLRPALRVAQVLHHLGRGPEPGARWYEQICDDLCNEPQPPGSAAGEGGAARYRQDPVFHTGRVTRTRIER